MKRDTSGHRRRKTPAANGRSEGRWCKILTTCSTAGSGRITLPGM